jgi:hypothetical protein
MAMNLIRFLMQPNNALHRTAIPLRSIATGELLR